LFGTRVAFPYQFAIESFANRSGQCDCGRDGAQTCQYGTEMVFDTEH
jgi:hypothetical protein